MDRVRGRCVEISRDYYRPSREGGAVLQQCEAPYDLLALQFAISRVSFPLIQSLSWRKQLGFAMESLQPIELDRRVDRCSF